MRKFAILICLLLLPVVSWADHSVGSAKYSVDATTFYFDVVLNNIPTENVAIFRIADTVDAFGGGVIGVSYERLAVNFNSTTGDITSSFSQEFGTPEKDRWPTQPLNDLTVTANGALSWRIVGSIPHGNDPFVAGDIIQHTVIRVVVENKFIDRSWYNEPITSTGLTYSLSGTVSGLTEAGLELQNSGGDTLSVPAAGSSFAFATKLPDGATYAVTVSSQPMGQTCSVTAGSGAITKADVTDVKITCINNAIPPGPAPTNPVAVPTMSIWGIGMLTGMLGLLGMYHRRRK